jgi:hypothetical protein
MRRLVSIYLISIQDRPKGFIQPLKFCKSNLWDVAVERPFRRFDSGDKIYQREPSERFSRGNNVPKGLFWRWDFFCSSLRDGN